MQLINRKIYVDLDIVVLDQIGTNKSIVLSKKLKIKLLMI